MPTINVIMMMMMMMIVMATANEYLLNFRFSGPCR